MKFCSAALAFGFFGAANASPDSFEDGRDLQRGKKSGVTDAPTPMPTPLMCPGDVDPIIVETTPMPTTAPLPTGKKGMGMSMPLEGDFCPFEFACPPCVKEEGNFDVVLVPDTQVFGSDTILPVDCLDSNANNAVLANSLINYTPEACFELDDIVTYDLSRSTNFFTPAFVMALNGFLTSPTTPTASIVESGDPLVIAPGSKTLVLVNPATAYSSDEINDMFCFIQGGGRIVMLSEATQFAGDAGDAGSLAVLNTVLDTFGASADFVPGSTRIGDTATAVFGEDICTGVGSSVTGGTPIAQYDLPGKPLFITGDSVTLPDSLTCDSR